MVVHKQQNWKFFKHDARKKNFPHNNYFHCNNKIGCVRNQTNANNREDKIKPFQ